MKVLRIINGAFGFVELLFLVRTWIIIHQAEKVFSSLNIAQQAPNFLYGKILIIVFIFLSVFQLYAAFRQTNKKLHYGFLLLNIMFMGVMIIGYFQDRQASLQVLENVRSEIKTNQTIPLPQ